VVAGTVGFHGGEHVGGNHRVRDTERRCWGGCAETGGHVFNPTDIELLGVGEEGLQASARVARIISNHERIRGGTHILLQLKVALLFFWFKVAKHTAARCNKASALQALVTKSNWFSTKQGFAVFFIQLGGTLENIIVVCLTLHVGALVEVGRVEQGALVEVQLSRLMHISKQLVQRLSPFNK
jgi:hypothetical protein